MGVADSPQRIAQGGRNKRMLWWYALGLAIGVLRLATVATVPPDTPLRSTSTIVLIVAIVLTVGLAGWAAQRAGLRGSQHGALVGLWYAMPAGLADVLFPLTPAQVAVNFQKVQQKLHLTAAQVHLDEQTVERASTHWESFVAAMVVYAVLGFVLGSLGSLFAGGPKRRF